MQILAMGIFLVGTPNRTVRKQYCIVWSLALRFAFVHGMKIVESNMISSASPVCRRQALWTGFLLYGVGFGGVGAMLSLLVIDTFGATHFGKIQGMIQLGVAFPSISAPILGGYIYDTTGNYHLHFAITIPIFVTSMLLLASGRPAVRAVASKQR